MDPIFAPTLRKIEDLRREHARVIQARQTLTDLRSRYNSDMGFGDSLQWVANAALSAGASGLYTGMEDIVRGLLVMLDRHVPGGDSSHQDILDQASYPVEGVRPAVLSADVYELLSDLKNFRHFERHNYRFKFKEEQVTGNELLAERLVPLFVRDVMTLIADLSRSNEPDATNPAP